ncbi:enolase C-terminal domain-like protein [Nocardia arizonensis]|uniref:enolase C-terminal domain-like protein n=1 Tax=Nocardia arizonensis TaxID=1141647 RepID=UPI0006D110E4|nr:enolase C-terminal domain-like protein [Nocardia arizonensis]
MKLDWHSIRIELREPLRISRATMSTRDAVWVTFTDADTLGRGEVVTSPRLGITLDAIDRALRQVADWVATERDPRELRVRLPELRALLPDALPVVAAVDVALHDFLAIRAGQPLDAYLGMPQWDSAPTAYTLGIVPVENAVRGARELTAAGFTVLKLKLGSTTPDDDIARVRAVRAAAPDARLILDPNGAWDAETAVRVLTDLADARIAAVEQPVPAGELAALDAVAAAIPMPVIADEDAGTVEQLELLPPSVAGINIKLAECGGLHAAVAMIEWARTARMDVMLGCQASTSASIAPAAHLSGAARWIDLDGHLLIADDPWRGLAGSDGILRRPAGLGSGIERRETAA